MTTLDETRAAIRRRAIADGWPTTLLSIAEDFADTAREDGTHALRSRQDQAHRLGVSEATVKRGRQELQRLGVLRERRRGGRGRGASVMDLTTGSVTPDLADGGSLPRVDVTHDPADGGSMAGQSRVTVEREPDPRLLSSSPTSSEPEPPMDDATWLAAELDSEPDLCRAAIERKTRQAEERGRPWLNVTHMVRSVVPLDEWRQAIHHTPKPQAQRRTLHQCGQPDCAGPHDWQDTHNHYRCQGA